MSPSFEHIGSYSISVTLTDTATIPLTSNYKIKLTIIPPSTQSTIN